MEVRILAESDAAAWWQLRLESLQHDAFAFGKAVEEHLETPVATIAGRFRTPTDASFTLGAFESDTLVGMVTYIRETGLKERHKGRIYGVYVTPAHRGYGVARALIAALLERARHEPGLEQILLAVASSQDPAKKLYRGFGFETFGTEPNALKIGSSYVDEEHMILRLAFSE